MPVYDFECRACGATSELLVRSSTIKPRCPACGSAKMARGFSAPSIITKGGSKSTPGSSSKSKSKCSRGSCGGCSGCH